MNDELPEFSRARELTFRNEIQRAMRRRQMSLPVEAVRGMMDYVGVKETPRTLNTWQARLSHWLNPGEDSRPDKQIYIRGLMWLMDCDETWITLLMGAVEMRQLIAKENGNPRGTR